MRISIAIGCIIGVVIFAAHITTISVPSEHATPSQAETLIFHDLKLTTDTWALFSVDTGAIIGTNVPGVFPIASITKLFTAMIVEESGRAEESVYITREDVAYEGGAGKLVAGTETTLHALLFPLLIESSNDAGYALSRVLGVDFYDEIAHIQQEFPETYLVDATGVSPRNVSSLKDLAEFYITLRREHPHLIDITELSTYIGTDTGYSNNNPARQWSNFTGGKHGYTPEAGYTFLGSFATGVGSREIGIVILGSKDLRADLEQILTAYGFLE